MKHIELFKDGFNDTINEKIQPENWPYVGNDGVSGEIVYTLVPEIVYYDVRTLKQINIPVITYREVDLGLPSGTLWADRNVGAENPWDNGAYFSWGSTNGVSISGTDKYLEDDIIRIILSKYQNVPADTITQEMIDAVKLEAGENLKPTIEYLLNDGLIIGTTFDWETTPYYSGIGDDNISIFSKYNKTDELTVLEAIDDAATVNMGSDWRMPTNVETKELLENTDYYYIGKDGSIVDKSLLDSSIELRSICFVKKGEDFDYNDRSNFIEFPFAGRCQGSFLQNNGVIGYVWSSSFYSTELANNLFFENNGALDATIGSGIFRSDGYSVRGVRA